MQRFKRGSGLPIQVPVVDLMEIGAGGGSIARINRMGLLQVGSRKCRRRSRDRSCYGRGGREPTVTDADLVLGYLDPDYFLGGAMDSGQAGGPGMPLPARSPIRSVHHRGGSGPGHP